MTSHRLLSVSKQPIQQSLELMEPTINNGQGEWWTAQDSTEAGHAMLPYQKHSSELDKY